MKANARISSMTRVSDWVSSKKNQGLLLASITMGAMTSARADLPEVEQPSRGGNGILELWQNYSYDIIVLLGLIVCSVAFLGVAYHSYNVYGEVQARKATWGQFGATVAVGGGLIVLIIWMLTKASEIL
ncbi:TIGR03745 family integrating conjugative element membrane protein [Pseudomonas kunmingensis]|nr:TIGR03745 family integrating conjugative element membrane protein [Stutzerimonas kunmingensis]MCQ2036644.1 TIGR03745 family integrating conjugative element membrane protein [Stutzerimonas kunmingensis]